MFDLSYITYIIVIKYIIITVKNYLFHINMNMVKIII